jgi:hypothetical protein
MRLRKFSVSFALLCALTLVACAHTRGNETDLAAARGQNDRDVKALVAAGTAGTLATAAWLSQRMPGDSHSGQTFQLIEHAEELAPDRPEIVWLHLAICESLKCDAEVQIETRLKRLDPGNGFAWLPDLRRAQGSGADAALTAAIIHIGAAPGVTVYWNQLVVMMTDSLAIADPSRDLVERAIDAIGMVAATPIPPMQELSKACRLDQFDQPGRRAACAAMVARLEESGATITQMEALDIEARWWPADSPQRDAVLAKRRRLDYLLMTSSRTNWWRLKRDMVIRIDAARRSEREEDVEIAMLKSYGLPLDPPPRWQDPLYLR